MHSRQYINDEHYAYREEKPKPVPVVKAPVVKIEKKEGENAEEKKDDKKAEAPAAAAAPALTQKASKDVGNKEIAIDVYSTIHHMIPEMMPRSKEAPKVVEHPEPIIPKEAAKPAAAAAAGAKKAVAPAAAAKKAEAPAAKKAEAPAAKPTAAAPAAKPAAKK